MAVRAHQAGRGISRHRGLADGEHVGAGADDLEELDQIVDIVVEIEAPLLERHQLGVAPVGDEDVVAGKHPLDRAAQQGRIMARHRRDDQQLRAAFDALAAEMLELAERLAEHDLFGDRHRLAVDDGCGDAEFRLAARRRDVREYVKGRCNDRPHMRVSERICRVLHPAGADVGERAGTGEQRALHFISVVKQPALHPR